MLLQRISQRLVDTGFIKENKTEILILFQGFT